jgi:hypothetical protein
LFAESNGVIIKVGDVSHPNSVEVVSCYPDWAERNERFLNDIKQLLFNFHYDKGPSKKPYYVS